MVKVKVGDIVPVTKIGESTKGRYVLCEAKSENGKESVAIFASNANAIPEGTPVCEVVSIQDVTKTASEYPKGSGKWFPKTNITATLKVAGEMSNADMFAQIAAEDIPF